MEINAYYHDDQIVDDSLPKDSEYIFDDDQPLNEWFNYLLDIKNGEMNIKDKYLNRIDISSLKESFFQLFISPSVFKSADFNIILNNSVLKEETYLLFSSIDVFKEERYLTISNMGLDISDMFNIYMITNIDKSGNFYSLYNFGVHSYIIQRILSDEMEMSDDCLNDDSHILNEETTIGGFMDYLFCINSKEFSDIRFTTDLNFGLSRDQKYEILSWLGVENYDFFEALILGEVLNKEDNFNFYINLNILKEDTFNLIVGTRILGMLLFKGKEFKQNIDDGNI